MNDKTKKYLQAQLSEQESEKLTRKLIRAKFDQSKRADWKQKLAAKGVHRAIDSSKAKVRSLRYILAIAASLLVPLMTLPLLRNYLEDPSYQAIVAEEMAVPFPNLEIRKGAMEEQQWRMDAIVAYNQQDYQAAIEGWEKIKLETTKVKVEDLFYLGLSYLYKTPAQPEQAIELLTRIKREFPNRYQTESEWFLALAYLQTNQIQTAKPKLEKVAQGKWKQKEAKALLKAIANQ